MLLAACAQTPKLEQGTVFYPAPPETPRIQFLVSITAEDDLGKSSDLREYLLGEQKSEKQLVRPFGIAHDKGHIYVADKTIKKIIVIDLADRSFSYIKDIKAGALKDPMGVVVTDDGYKYVADAGRGQIVVFNERNEFSRAYGDEKQFRPTSVAVYGNKIYVCDILENEIEVLDKDTGAVLSKIGKTGQAEGELHRPTHLIVDDAGNLFVTDALNFRIQKFDQNGTYIRSIGELGTYPGTFGRPKGIDIDKDGHIYTADASFELIQIFDTETGEPLLPFGKFGPAPGSTYLPSAVHVDYDNVEYFTQYADPDFKLKYLIYVGNMLGNHKLNVYGFGEWTGTSFKNVYQPPEREGK
ncbi:MAG: hypothetical protein KAS48_06655, partial [Gammaproteobacteria bacterium]|nr:hypothetical protein [Gammaproteobacteria bacterium]